MRLFEKGEKKVGLLGEILEEGATILGETGRRIRTANREEKTITGEAAERLKAFIQKAEEGDVDAIMSLASWYIEGTTLRFDPNQACYWWTKAAELGDPNAMYNLGLLYNGDLAHTFACDDNMAVFWLSEASARGHIEARQVLEEDYKWSPLFQKWKRR